MKMFYNKKGIQYLISMLIVLNLMGCTKNDLTTNSNTVAQLKTIRVSDTDSTILYNPTANHLYRECDSGSCINDQLLFVFFPGSDGLPQDHTKIAEVIGKTGIRVLVLAYQNNGSLQTICGTTDSCYSNARQARFIGAASSAYVMSLADGVANRLLKALQALGWSQFYSGSTIYWSKIIVGGFSQGAGMAAWTGKNYSVARVCQFSGTWDHTIGTTSATWLSGASVTSSNLFYGFTHQEDSLTNGVSYLDINWQALGMGAGSYQLYTASMTGQKMYANDTDASCVANAHGCSVLDSATPNNIDGSPKYSSVWKYVCGR
jgi:hypothetical protein